MRASAHKVEQYPLGFGIKSFALYKRKDWLAKGVLFSSIKIPLSNRKIKNESMVSEYHRIVSNTTIRKPNTAEVTADYIIFNKKNKI